MFLCRASQCPQNHAHDACDEQNGQENSLLNTARNVATMPVHMVRHGSRSEASPQAKNAGTITSVATAALRSTVTFSVCCRNSREVQNECQAALTAIDMTGKCTLMRFAHRPNNLAKKPFSLVHFATSLVLNPSFSNQASSKNLLM